MGDPHGGPQTSPQHADPHGLGALILKKTIPEIYMDLRVVGWSAGRHVDHRRVAWAVSMHSNQKCPQYCWEFHDQL